MTNQNEYSSPAAYTRHILSQADHFVLHRYPDKASRICATLDEAREAARRARAKGFRVLVYAVTSRGRSVLVG